MFALLLVSAVHLSTCHNVLDVEYSERVVSDHEGDLFGYSWATSCHKLVIGAPWDDNTRGSVMVDDGVRVKGPAGDRFFGYNVDVNQQFMVVSGGQHPYSMYVYQSQSSYDMVAKIPMDGCITSLVISDDNTIAVSHSDKNHGYDGSSTWNIAQKFKLEDEGNSLAVYRDILVAGVPFASLVHIFNRVGGKWVKGQTIKHFGDSVSIYGPGCGKWW